MAKSKKVVRTRLLLRINKFMNMNYNFNKAHFKKGIAPIIIALIVAVLAGGGYVVVKTNPGLAKKLGMEKQIEKKEAITDKKDETANWKTYKNNEYGFQFDYPLNAKIESKKLTTVKDVNFGLAINIYPDFIANADRESRASLEILIGNLPKQDVCYPDSSQGAVQEVINGINFMAVPWKTSIGKRVDQTGVWSLQRRLSVVKNQCYQIIAVIEGEVGKNLSAQDLSQRQSIFDQIISTFKFTAPATPATSDWKTYKNKRHGFEFSIPKDWVTSPESMDKTSPESYASITSSDFKTVFHPGELEYSELIQGGVIRVYVQEPSPKSMKTLKELSEFNKLGRDGGPDFKNERVIVVNGVDALLYDYDYEGGSRGGRGHKLALLSENRWVSIEIQYVTADGSKIWAEILSTLEFTK
ncbi:MAG: PsbP-related protein [bacterium]|nr:PsbP-related protein [bacterium]